MLEVAVWQKTATMQLNHSHHFLLLFVACHNKIEGTYVPTYFEHLLVKGQTSNIANMEYLIKFSRTRTLVQDLIMSPSGSYCRIWQ